MRHNSLLPFPDQFDVQRQWNTRPRKNPLVSFYDECGDVSCPDLAQIHDIVRVVPGYLRVAMHFPCHACISSRYQQIHLKQ